MGSFAGYTSTPLLSVYAGTKSFMYSFSQALGSELEEKGITVSYINSYLVVSCLCPFDDSGSLIGSISAL